ncbi:MAG: HlyD family efflux transporter periplasmic adaptor subunit [Oscillospiraceae bacterium]|jgi:RND family efflux transporter MFP subunit
MENSVRKREWVKTAAIIFLAVLLVLTFFSKTIMNASLPEVAAQQAASGAINARIRGSGTVEASEVYNVTIKQTRKVASVLVKTGQEINVGDTMFVLEAEDSDELKQAETDLETLQQNYDKSLIEAGNTAAQENYDVQKAREAYNEALAVYNQYTNVNAAQLTAAITAAENELTNLTAQSKAISEELKQLQTDKETIDADVTAQEAKVKEMEAAEDKYAELKTATDDYDADIVVYGKYYSKLLELTAEPTSSVTYDNKHVITVVSIASQPIAAGYCQKDTMLYAYLVEKGQTEMANDAGIIATAYKTITEDLSKLATLCTEYSRLSVVYNPTALSNARTELSNLKNNADHCANLVKSCTERASAAETAVSNKQTEIDKLTKASSAADTVKSTKQALEDLVFKQNLGDSSSVDMEASKKAIERKQAEVDKLRENADELEVKSSVSGTIASINASAGKSIGGEEQPLATINVTDRGFTVKIDVTNDQAKKVKTGDTAELVNFWGGDAVATLDQITSSQTAGNRTLVFTLTGDIQAGQNVTLSIGQKSANYDALIPLSGLREDSNGKFVYVLESKSSPLGSRYIATRVTVQELARDDKSAAVSGISSGDFIITTSNKPVEAGKQVRLADNG